MGIFLSFSFIALLYIPSLLTSNILPKVSGEPTGFRWTASADSRSDFTEFQYTLSELKRVYGNEGEFHIACGDLDPLPGTYETLKDVFGPQIKFYPILGNHDLDYINWYIDYYNNKLDGNVNPGPLNGEETSYSFDYQNAHFVILNFYFDGESHTGTDGDVVDELYNWLENDLENNTQPFIFLFGHDPAFPENRHVGDSLDQYEENRDRFWQLLVDNKASAFFCGHTHYYYSKEIDGVWQIDLGSARETGDGKLTYANIEVGPNEVIIQPYVGGFREELELVDEITIQNPNPLPTNTPSPAPTDTPTPVPTDTPTPIPTNTPTPLPTDTPTPATPTPTIDTKPVSPTPTPPKKIRAFVELTIGDPYMYVNFEKQEIDPGRGTTAVIVQERTLIPIRAVMEAIGGVVTWNEAEKKVTINVDGILVELSMLGPVYVEEAVFMGVNQPFETKGFYEGNKTMKVNGEIKINDVAPIIMNDRMFLPFRFVAESVGSEVSWDGDLKKVTLKHYEQ